VYAVYQRENPWSERFPPNFAVVFSFTEIEGDACNYSVVALQPVDFSSVPFFLLGLNIVHFPRLKWSIKIKNKKKKRNNNNGKEQNENGEKNVKVWSELENFIVEDKVSCKK